MSDGAKGWIAAVANVAAVLAVLLAVLVFLSGRFDWLGARMVARFEAMDARVDAVAEGRPASRARCRNCPSGSMALKPA